MIGVVYNPHARVPSRDPSLLARLRATVGGDGRVLPTRDRDELDAAVDEIARDGLDPVAICGGDGTGHATLTALVRRYGADRLPRIALLRGGTVNTIAGNLGLRRGPEEMLARIVAGARDGGLRTVEQEILAVRADGRDDEYGFLLAAAMGARFLAAYYDGPPPLLRPILDGTPRPAGPGEAFAARGAGISWAALLAARTAASCLVPGGGHLARRLFAPVPLEIVADGVVQPIDGARFLVASTVRDVGLGMRIAWRAGSERGRLHLVASGLSTLAMARQLGRVRAGEPLVGAPHVDTLATDVEVRFAAPEVYTLDGELLTASRLRVRVGARARVVIAD